MLVGPNPISAAPGISDQRRRQIKVVGVLGTSFSGSTVLNLMLGAHSQIYAGGELIGLFVHRGNPINGACTSCGATCKHWTDDARKMVREENLYALASEIFGKRIIVDTSKSISWFNDVLRSDAHKEVVPTFVLMVKHPIRYLASNVINIAGARPRSRYKRLVASVSGAYNRKAMSDEWLFDLSRYYAEFFVNLPRQITGATFHVIHYERLIDDPRRTLAPLLESLGLGYEPQIDNFYDADFHQIGGNNGALFQTKRDWNGGDKGVPDFRLKFYETNRALKIDNKYLKTFSSREIEALKSHPAVRRLNEQLGYDNPDMPFRI